MLAMKPVIVFIMLFAPSLCEDPPTTPSEPDFGSPQEFLKEVNEYRAKFAKKHKIPNMYKLVWSNELAEEQDSNSGTSASMMSSVNLFRVFKISLSRWPAELIDYEIGKLKNQNDLYEYVDKNGTPIELINPLQSFIGCFPYALRDEFMLDCLIGFMKNLNFRYAEPGEAGSQCPPRFKGENGLCVPVDPTTFTFWGTEEGLLEDVNYMRRKYAKKFGIPNMHQLTWDASLVDVLKSLDWDGDVNTHHSGWDGLETRWRMAELITYSAAATAIDEAVHDELVLNQSPSETYMSGIPMYISALELIHPLQTSIGCMKKEQGTDRGKFFTACLLGNMPSEWKFDMNLNKIPGSECMDGYVNDDGLCVLAPPTTTPKPTTPTTPEATTTPKTTEKTTSKEAETVPVTPMKPEASDEKKEKEGASVEEDAELEPGQEALESSVTTRSYSYGLLILAFTCLLF